MKFVESSIFTKQVLEQLTDDAYRALQTALLIKPDAGALIKNSGKCLVLVMKSNY